MNATVTTIKSTTLELSINPGYVQGWGVWEALRELIQNGLDSADQGNASTIERGGGQTKTIYIRNEGCVLARNTLLLGATSKADGGSRGKFGEGYKLAFLVLCRNNIMVQVRTGSEMWTPFIEKSDTFGSDVLKLKIRPTTKHENKIELQIHGVSDNDWEIICQRLLDIPGVKPSTLADGESVKVGLNRVLLAPRFKSKLFSRGLYVGMLPDEYTYGYDLAHVQLDRDRKAADVWSLRSELSSTLRQALDSGLMKADEVFKLLSVDCGETKVIGDYYAYGYADSLTKNITEEFERINGTSAVPVSNMAESMEASHFGLQGRVVSKALRNLIEKERGEFEKRKVAKAFDIVHYWSFVDLTKEEQENLSWATQLVANVESRFSLENLQIVDFIGETVEGTWSSSTGVRLARKMLSERKKLIAVLVHEVAHMDGASDGSVEHRDAIDRIFSGIVVSLAASS